MRAVMLTLWALAAAAGSPTGTLAPSAKIDGQPGKCAILAQQIGKAEGRHRAESPDGSPLELPAGTYALVARCGALSPPLDAVEIRAGRTTKLDIDARTARFRVMAERGSKRIKAKVLLYRAAGDETPLAGGAANLKFDVARGVYDVLVEQEDAEIEPPPSVWFRRVRIDEGAVVERKADLSNGRLRVSVSQNGKPAGAKIKVLPRRGTIPVANAEPGQTVSLPPSEYRVQVNLLDAADFPTEVIEVEIPPNADVTRAAAFKTGTLSVNVLRDGRPLDAMVHLSLPGAADYFNFFPAPGAVILSPGTFDVSVEPKGAGPIVERTRSAVAVIAGRESTLKMDLSPARLNVVVRRSKKPVVPLDVRVRYAGGGDDAAKAEPDGTFRLWPGRYELVIGLPDGTQIVDGPFAAALRENIERVVEYTRGELAIAAMRGTTIADAEVFVYKPGAQIPMAKGRAQSLIELAPGVYDVKVVAGHEWRWERAIKVEDGKTTKLEARFKPAEGQAAPEGERAPLPDALPEGEDDLPAGE